jgi:lipid-binding SYLF domain-containing protein
MLRLNQVATLLACLLFVFGSAAVAQDSGCAQTSKDKCGAGSSTQREKPSAGYKPARSIAPRELPAVYAEEARRAADAAQVLSSKIAQNMVRNEKAIAVIPGVKKGAFGFGVRRGKGLLTMRDEDGHWIPPAFIQITGGNVGLQLGFESTDLVLVFTDESAINALLRGKLTLNADASAAAGPFGRYLEAGVPILINSGIYAYSLSKGLFAGVSVDGSAITIDDSSNERVYGKYINGDQILLDRRVESNAAVAPFLNTLEKYSPGSNAQQAAAGTTQN